VAIKLITFTTLYPDSTRPAHGIFVENRLRHLVAGSKIVSRVVAPLPWFPFSGPRFGNYARYAGVPVHEVRNGIAVDHPRYPLIPKVGMTLAPWVMAAALKPKLVRICRNGYDFDVIDAHYFYPDGVAAVLLGRSLQKPVVITARGSDLNRIADYFFPRHMIQWAAKQSAGLITVCQALKEKLIQLGTEAARITVLRNGVDLAMFQPPKDRISFRQDLRLGEAKTLLSVGALIPLKGHDLIIRALADLPGFKLLIAGEGPEKSALLRLAASVGVQERVEFLGVIGHEKLAAYYGAVDATVLASSREGWPNVLLESMACGTPVVATAIGGIPEIVTQPQAGVLVRDRDSNGIASGVQALFSRYPDRAATRRFAEQFSWDATTAGLEELFAGVVRQRENSRALRLQASRSAATKVQS
jgi:teichuronic acid biosynthesis glycosyltransferase TuaC